MWTKDIYIIPRWYSLSKKEKFLEEMGETNVIDYNIRLQNGRFRSLPKKVYDDIRISLDCP